jgi:hypothetical protein
LESLDICGCVELSAKSTDGNSRSRIQDSNVILTDDPHGICGQSARYIAHLLPNFPGTRVTSFSTDGNLRLKFTVFARVFAFRLLRPLLLHRNQFRLYATISALESPGTPLCVLEGQVSSFLLARERKRLCVDPRMAASVSLPSASCASAQAPTRSTRSVSLFAVQAAVHVQRFATEPKALCWAQGAPL